jgi:hypothetical protein
MPRNESHSQSLVQAHPAERAHQANIDIAVAKPSIENRATKTAMAQLDNAITRLREATGSDVELVWDRAQLLKWELAAAVDALLAAKAEPVTVERAKAGESNGCN